jgi:hypothetical protein
MEPSNTTSIEYINSDPDITKTIRGICNLEFKGRLFFHPNPYFTIFVNEVQVSDVGLEVKDKQLNILITNNYYYYNERVYLQITNDEFYNNTLQCDFYAFERITLKDLAWVPFAALNRNRRTAHYECFVNFGALKFKPIDLLIRMDPSPYDSANYIINSVKVNRLRANEYTLDNYSPLNIYGCKGNDLLAWGQLLIYTNFESDAYLDCYKELFYSNFKNSTVNGTKYTYPQPIDDVIPPYINPGNEANRTITSLIRRILNSIY